MSNPMFGHEKMSQIAANTIGKRFREVCDSNRYFWVDLKRLSPPPPPNLLFLMWKFLAGFAKLHLNSQNESKSF